MRFSFSMLEKYMSCPLKAKYHYFDRLPGRQSAAASFGSCIHAALELYNKSGNLAEAEERFVDYWTNPDKIGVTPETWPNNTNFGSYMTRGLNCLRDFAEKDKWETRQVLATEHKFLVPIGEHTLSGFVDLLDIKKGKNGKPTLRIVDYKTNTSAPSIQNLHLNVQFTAYYYASLQHEFWVGDGTSDIPGLPNGQWLWDMYGNTIERRAIWYGLHQSKEYDAGERGDEDFMRMYRVMNSVAEAVERDVFVPSISGDACTFCDYTQRCGIPIPPREIVPDPAF